MSLDTAPTRTSYRGPVVLVISVVVLFICLTWTFLAMRAVMAIGGACADGGPYVSAQPCPDGAGLMAVAIPVMIITAMVGSAVAISLNAPNLLIPMWAVLFGTLGWNFLEFAFNSGGAVGSDGIVWGWLVCGVMFELMALPAVLVIIVGVRDAIRPPAEVLTPRGSPWWFPVYSLFGALGVFAGWWTFNALT